MPPLRQLKVSPRKINHNGFSAKGCIDGYFPQPISVSKSLRYRTETKSFQKHASVPHKQRNNVGGRQPFTLSPAVQSFSDSYINTKSKGPDDATVNTRFNHGDRASLKKAKFARSEQGRLFHPKKLQQLQNSKSQQCFGSTSRSNESSSGRPRKTCVSSEAIKFKTASSRLLSKFPEKFVPDAQEGDQESKACRASIGRTSQKLELESNVAIFESISKPDCVVKSPSLSHLSAEEPLLNVVNREATMLASENKKPLSLMEQKKLQWAREKEELNGLWSPWGRPHSKTGLPTHNPTRCSNKLLTSTFQSECLLPPISNHITLESREQKSTHWTCDSIDGKEGNKSGYRKGNLPMCINATTGEVHFNHNANTGKKTHHTDSFQVNNSIVISTSNINSANSTTSSLLPGNGIEGKKLTYYTQQQQSSAHSLSTRNISGKGGGWSSFDEETFTSGYQSESNGFLSNGEDYGYHSRNGSGDNNASNRKSHGSRHKKQNNLSKSTSQLSPDSSSGRGEFSNAESKSNVSSFEGPTRGPGSGGVVLQNPHGDSMQSSMEETRESFVSRNNQLNEIKSQIQTSRSTSNLSSVFNSGLQSKIKAQPPPPAMRSSIPVGVDPPLDPETLRQLQRMEREKWLQELEKQREEQRLRKQMEKDEKRPKWGDRGIGVGHFWEPSLSEDGLPQPRRDEGLVVQTPAWLEKSLSRMQNSVSQPSLTEVGLEQKSDFSGISTSRGFSNQSSVDLRNVIGLNDSEENSRSYGRGQNIMSDPDANAERERKRQAAMEHQEAIRKQIEERQKRLREEKERRLQEELEDEEKLKMQRLRELERMELEARKLGRCYNSGEENEDAASELADLTEASDVRRILKGSGRTSAADVSRAESRRFSFDDQSLPEELQGSRFGSNMTSSQSMLEISRQNSPRFPFADSTQDLSSVQLMRIPSPKTNEPAEIIQRERDRPISSQRSRSLSHHREFGTQTDHEQSMSPTLQLDGKHQRHHKSHNCLTKNGNKSKSSTGEESEGKKSNTEKPRWGATPSKKQYLKQSEKDPLYQQRLKRRMDRIKKFEERLNNMGLGMDGGKGDHVSRDSGSGTGGTETESDNANNERQVRSPPSRLRSRSNQKERHTRNNRDGSYEPRPELAERTEGSRTSRSSRRQNGVIGASKSSGRISINHNHQEVGRKTSPLRAGPRHEVLMKDEEKKPRMRKVFPEIPGRTIGPLKPTLNGDFDQTFLHGSSENSSRFSSPSLESISSHKNTTSHYYSSHRVLGRGDDRTDTRTLEVDLESHYMTSTSRSIAVHYEDGSGNATEVVLVPQSTSKKTVVESSDEVTYRKTVIQQNSTMSPTASIAPEPERDPIVHSNETQKQKIKSYQSRQSNKAGPAKKRQMNVASPSHAKTRSGGASQTPATPAQEPVPRVSETYEEFRQLTPSFSFDDVPAIPPNISMADFDEIPVGIPSSKLNDILNQKSLTSTPRSVANTPVAQPTEPSPNTTAQLPQPTPTQSFSTVPTPLNSSRMSPNAMSVVSVNQSRLNSPPVPAVLKKLQAGIPIEDLAVCDDVLYEIPRVNTAGSTSNGYKSVESDSSHSQTAVAMSRFSSTGAMEGELDASGPPECAEEESCKLNETITKAGCKMQQTITEDDREEELDHTQVLDQDDRDGDGHDEKKHRKSNGNISSDSFGHREEDDEEEDEEEEEEHKVAFEEPKASPQSKSGLKRPHLPRSKSTLDCTNTPWKPLSSIYDNDLYDAEPLYPYPIPKLSPRINSPYLPKSFTTVRSPSPTYPRLSRETTTLEVRADYRPLNLPHYDCNEVKVVPQLGTDSLKVSARLHRPRTQDTDLSKREKLISYVLNNKDIQAQISARDSELSEKGIIEFNVRLPSNMDGDCMDHDYHLDDSYQHADYEDYNYNQYKDPLLSERQRATLRWLYSSESSSSSNPRDTVLTHLSYLKKGIQKQQQEWNVVPSDTEDTCDEDNMCPFANRKTLSRFDDDTSSDSKYSS